ncbi:MAG: hypothetical protein AAGI91_10860 [Bacteroidota bacterium]
MRSQRLIALFGLGVVVFTYPLLSLFSSAEVVLGLPVFYAYLFGVWAGLIGLAAWVIEGRRPRLPAEAERAETDRAEAGGAP